MMSTLPVDRFISLIKQISGLPLGQLPGDIDLSRSAIPLLMWVSRTPGCGVLDIAKGLQLSPPTISVGIHRLVKGGWLERRTDPADQRTRPLYLTSKGEALITRIKAHRTQMIKAFLAGLTPEEQQQLLDLMDKSVRAMEKSMKNGVDRVT